MDNSCSAVCNRLFAITVILLACSAAGLGAATKLKNLHTVPDDVRVPGCYFVNVRYNVPESRIHQLVAELRTLDANASLPAFSARVMFVLTKIGYGFSAELSAEALYYVSLLSVYKTVSIKFMTLHADDLGIHIRVLVYMCMQSHYS